MAYGSTYQYGVISEQPRSSSRFHGHRETHYNGEQIIFEAACDADHLKKDVRRACCCCLVPRTALHLIYTVVAILKTLGLYCHWKIGPPQNRSGRTNFTVKFGPPGPVYPRKIWSRRGDTKNAGPILDHVFGVHSTLRLAVWLSVWKESCRVLAVAAHTVANLLHA